jgi:hypothetical protein
LKSSNDFYTYQNGTKVQIRYSPYGNGTQFVISGRSYHFDGSDDYPYDLRMINNKSWHIKGIIFTFFVMQVFNFINSRQLKNKINIFAGDTCFDWLIGSILATPLLGMSILMSDDGYSILKLPQWGIIAGFGFGEWVIGALSKIISCKRWSISGRRQPQSLLAETEGDFMVTTTRPEGDGPTRNPRITLH